MQRKNIFSRLVLIPLFTSITLVLSACSGSGSGGAASKGNGLSDIRAYERGGMFADVLADCARQRTYEGSCTQAKLPFIAVQTNNPDIAAIMERVAVSHDWMGRRFQQVLEAMPPSMLSLFSAVTAIVIDADIRPSFYSDYTGAIYLDPAHFWLSNEEKRSINAQKDFRSNYADPLAFKIFSRYIKNGDYAFEYWPLDDDETRTLADIELIAARILLHELAHANDFFPPGSAALVNYQMSTAELLEYLDVDYASTTLQNQSRPTSERMYSLAGVMYRGNTPTYDDISTTATAAGMEFGNDVANDDYAYTSQFEDLAMLFESTMMHYYFGAELEIGFASPHTNNARICHEFTIDWGAINRIGHPSVKERARHVTSLIMPGLDMTDFYNTLPPAQSTDSNWCIESPVSISSAGNTTPRRQAIRPDEVERHAH